MTTRRIPTNKQVGLVLPEDNGNQQYGVICLANEERFTATHFSEPLTAYAIGWKDPENIRETLDLIAPPVQVNRRFEFKRAVNAEAFLSETDDIRAIGAPFKRVEYKGSSVNEKTFNKGLTVRIDRDEMTEGQEELEVGRLMNRLARNDLRRAQAAISAAATNTAKTWDTSAGKDPDGDVVSDLETGADSRGIMSNCIVYGENAWIKRLLSLRAQDLAGQSRSSTLTREELRQFFSVDKLIVSKERFQSSATAKSKIVGNLVLMYYSQPTISKDDPSDIKQFWTPTESGRTRVFREEHAKFIDVSVEHYSNIVITGNVGIRQFTIS